MIRSSKGKRGKTVVKMLLPLVLAVLLALLYPALGDSTREFRKSASFKENANAFLIGTSSAQATRQHSVQDMLVAFGSGALHITDPVGKLFVVNGRAYVRPANYAGELQSTGSFVNSAYLLGLEQGNQPVAVYKLSTGDPVPLSELYEALRASYSGKFAVLGVGSFDDVYARPVGDQEDPRPNVRNVGAVFYGIPDPGKMWGEGERILRTEALLSAEHPSLSRSAKPEEVLAAAAALDPDDIVRVYPESTLRKATVLVYRIQDFYLYNDFFELPLVEVAALDPTIVTDIRYATTHNFTGKRIYGASQAYLALPVAERLVRVNARLKKQGYRLKVWDAYRPASAQQLLWDVVPDRRYIAPPNGGSRHNRGAAVDVTLVTLDGKDVEMPTDFDGFSVQADRYYQGGSAESRRHRDLLQKAMTAEGFVPVTHEWWHFDSPDWWEYPVLDVPLR
ncbi:MAG: M15 family metallopeptidase [Clostridia bacterium]|nr:M15 family metallopeptidase [Clostridia bacterium]MDQ7791600.1 M15 family metallopeptidase [Clostridia bacterium]